MLTAVYSSAMIQQHILLTEEIQLTYVYSILLKVKQFFKWLMNLTCLHLSFPG